MSLLSSRVTTTNTFSALTLLVGWQEGHPACKNWVVGCWHGRLSGARCRLAYGQLMPVPLTVSCFSKIQIGLPFWYRLTRVVPDKGPLNGCVCVWLLQLRPVFVNYSVSFSSDTPGRVGSPRRKCVGIVEHAFTCQMSLSQLIKALFYMQLLHKSNLSVHRMFEKEYIVWTVFGFRV